MDKGICILCGKMCNMKQYPNGEDYCECANCGQYFIEHLLATEISKYKTIKEKDLALLSGYALELNDLGDRVTFTRSNYRDILNSPLMPTSILQKFDKFLLHLFRNSKGFNDAIIYSEDNYASCYATGDNEFDGIISYLRSKNYISDNIIIEDNYKIPAHSLTYDGIEYVEELIKTTELSSSAFVAMWFSDETAPAYEQAIKPAIENEACGGFKAFRVDNHQHNNDITDEIIAGIKECRFMVADFTGYRGGVYYEAGFARGLGKPVIYTCEKSWFEGGDGKPKIHFDLSHQNFIIWEADKIDDFKERLINRIRATII